MVETLGWLLAKKNLAKLRAVSAHDLAFGSQQIENLKHGYTSSILSKASLLFYYRSELVSMIFEGVFELFPQFRFGVLECGIGWVPFDGTFSSLARSRG